MKETSGNEQREVMLGNQEVPSPSSGNQPFQNWYHLLESGEARYLAVLELLEDLPSDKTQVRDPLWLRSQVAIRPTYLVLLALIQEGRVAQLEERVDLLTGFTRHLARYLEPTNEDEMRSLRAQRSTGETKEQLITSAEETLCELERSFDDLESRLELVMRVKDAIRRLWLFARRSDDKYVKQAANMLYDSLKYARAEELSKVQVTAVRESLARSKAVPMTITDVKRIHDALVSVGLEYMPAIKD